MEVIHWSEIGAGVGTLVSSIAIGVGLLALSDLIRRVQAMRDVKSEES